MLSGIDVSGYQPADIGARVDYDFLIAKCTEGTDYTSSVAPQQLQDALSRGKLAAGYHFASGGSIRAEVDAFARAFDPYLGRAIPVLDFEGNALAAGLGWAQDWIGTAHATLGVGPLLYGPASAVLGQPGPLWVAAYGANPVTYGYKIPAPLGVMRQYTSRGILPGYSGFLDLNAFWGSAADWQALTGSSSPAPAGEWFDMATAADLQAAIDAGISRALDGIRRDARARLYLNTATGQYFAVNWHVPCNDPSRVMYAHGGIGQVQRWYSPYELVGDAPANAVPLTVDEVATIMRLAHGTDSSYSENPPAVAPAAPTPAPPAA